MTIIIIIIIIILPYPLGDCGMALTFVGLGLATRVGRNEYCRVSSRSRRSAFMSDCSRHDTPGTTPRQALLRPLRVIARLTYVRCIYFATWG
jgi:hypothetical protein